jgi:hypothetical protein
MTTSAPLSSLADWYVPGTPKGRFGLQIALNSLMLSALIFLQSMPWLALAALLVTGGLTVLLHGPANRAIIVIYGFIGWAAEAWIVGVGGVWRFTTPATTVLDGGLFGVPFYMVPCWAMVGALMLALSAWWNAPVAAGKA